MNTLAWRRVNTKLHVTQCYTRQLPIQFLDCCQSCEAVWRHKIEEKLIEYVRAYSILYDFKNKRYKNQISRKVAWNEIGEKLGKSDEYKHFYCIFLHIILSIGTDSSYYFSFILFVVIQQTYNLTLSKMIVLNISVYHV